MEGANESKLKGMKEEEDRGDDKRCDPMGKAKEVIRDSLPLLSNKMMMRRIRARRVMLLNTLMIFLLFLDRLTLLILPLNSYNRDLAN